MFLRTKLLMRAVPLSTNMLTLDYRPTVAKRYKVLVSFNATFRDGCLLSMVPAAATVNVACNKLKCLVPYDVNSW